jgi:parallel beta-helix repeat protein
MDSNDEGIILSSLNENRIENNVFTRNVVGVFIQSSSMNNKICSNNFKKNHQNSYAECRNQWENNYWDDWVGLRCKWLRFLPYHIPGSLIYNFDWNPKREPYAS